jgi:hypothetical protein
VLYRCRFAPKWAFLHTEKLEPKCRRRGLNLYFGPVPLLGIFRSRGRFLLSRLTSGIRGARASRCGREAQTHSASLGEDEIPIRSASRKTCDNRLGLCEPWYVWKPRHLRASQRLSEPRVADASRAVCKIRCDGASRTPSKNHTCCASHERGWRPKYLVRALP